MRYIEKTVQRYTPQIPESLGCIYHPGLVVLYNVPTLIEMKEKSLKGVCQVGRYGKHSGPGNPSEGRLRNLNNLMHRTDD